jgi:hypothetical protein
LIQIIREPGKTAKFFVVLISIAAIAIILTGGAFVYPQQVNEAMYAQKITGIKKVHALLGCFGTTDTFSNRQLAAAETPG